MNITTPTITETAEHLFRPAMIAMDHLADMPSYIQVSDLDIPASFVRKLMANGSRLYKSYENININFAKYVDKLDHIVDRFVIATKAAESFSDTKYSECDSDILIYINLATESIPLVSSSKKMKEPTYIDSTLMIYYNANRTSDADLKLVLADIFKYCKINDEDAVTHDSYINLVVRLGNSLDTKQFVIKDPKMNLGLSYGEEFVGVDKTIFKGLQKSDKGIWVFHGPPGTGKSMYIRNIIKRLNKRKDGSEIIYMPSEMISSLESPDFIPFIQDYKDSILVIEDADTALESRDAQGSIVKTVLQLTDGILADCLRLKIIATFNCHLSKIDSALLRKGRLQYRHEFRLLTRAEALKLAASLKIDMALFETDDFRRKTEWTLAEIYNIQQDFHWDKKQTKIGF